MVKHLAAYTIICSCILAQSTYALIRVDVSSVDILAAAQEFDGTFPVANVIDRDSGYEFSDYASNAQGTDTFIDFDFGENIQFEEISYVDRVTSGGAQGSFAGGTLDFVTGYNYIFSTDATFGNGDDVVVSITGLTAPSSPSSPADFTATTNIASINARYLRWDVTSIAGGSTNTGASNFEFYTVPEPAHATLLLGLIVIGAGLRRRESR